MVTLVTFDDAPDVNIFNLSRVNPTDFRLHAIKPKKDKDPKYQPSGIKSRYIFHYTQQNPAICISLGLSVEDLTAEPHASGDFICKTFTMIPLALEQEREVATINIIGGELQYTGQVINNRLSYTTRNERPGVC